MPVMNKNIWPAFYLVSLIWAISLISSAYSTYERVHEEFVAEQVSLTVMSKNSLKAAFKQYEAILNIVASQVLINDNVASKKDIESLMQAAIDVNLSVRAFALLRLDGTVYTSLPVTPFPKNKAFLSNNQIKDTLRKPSNTNNMLVGRTYFSELLGTAIIPFRLAVRDDKGDAHFILTLAVSFDKSFDFFVNNIRESGLHNTYIYRERDRYFQLAPIDRQHDANIYNYQISQADVDASLERLSKRVKTPFAELKDKEIVFTDEDLHHSRRTISAAVYMKDYFLWLVTEIKFSAIQNAFMQKVMLLILLHFFTIILIFVLFKNIASNEKKKTTELEYLVNHDHLTKLFNRYYLDRYLASVDKQSVFSLIYLNIDHFKTVNDSHGQAFGDLILTKVALRITAIANKGDLVIRAGSDEFVLISLNKTEQQTSDICKQLLSCFHTPIKIDDSEIMLSASIGVSFYPKDSTTTEEIKRNANLAMYSAKKKRNTAVFFNETLLDDYLHLCSVENELKKAIVNHELYVLYQPQYSIDGGIIGVEALARWQNEKLGYMLPDKFIPVAESMGNMDAIGAFVIERTLSDITSIQNKTGKRFSVSINISVIQFKNPSFYDQLIAVVKKFDFPPELLILEVTESVLIDDIDSMRNLMIKIKKHNIRISLDDFGTGYSSLSILKNLPIDELKIDKSFVNDVINDKDSRSMIKSIISIAKNKKISTVAEGIESKEMLVALEQLECDIYQGYYFSKPVDNYALERLVGDKNL